MEAVHRRAVLRDGALEDTVLYGRLRPGWSPPAGGPAPAPPPPRRPRSGELRIRPTRLDDAAALAALCGDLDLAWGTYQLPFTPANVWSRRLGVAASAP